PGLRATRPSPIMASVTYDPGNVFAKILRGEIPADVVHEDELCLAFRDLHPQAPVHVLVVPKAPIARLGDATEDQRAILGHLLWVAGRIARAEGCGDAFR